MNIEAQSFWEEYKSALSSVPPAEAAVAYRSDVLWTPIAVEAVDKAIEKLGLISQHEYYRIDAIGYERVKTHNWILRVAFEHENRDHWTDELCKLSHIVADLKVLVSYWNFKEEGPVDSVLTKCLGVLNVQLQRNSGRWLFIFGPRCRSFGEQYPYVAYTYDGVRLEQLPDDGTLNPSHWSSGNE